MKRNKMDKEMLKEDLIAILGLALMVTLLFAFTNSPISSMFKMSDEEKINIAQRACDEAEVTREYEKARRVALINDARAELGKDVYGFTGIDFMIRMGRCTSLILSESDVHSRHWHLLD